MLLTLQHGDDSVANLVSTGLFGDGAAAVVMVGDAHPAALAGAGATGVDVVDTRSRLYPETADHLGWTIRDSGFGIVLSAGLPEVIAAHLAGDLKSLLADHDLVREDIGTWVVHAGGPRILDVVRDSLSLDEADLWLSRRSLAAVGNLSSSSVLHVLAATLDAHRDADRDADRGAQPGASQAPPASSWRSDPA
ncbi:hypothetical protein NKG05_13380 [Oerskovia sp. M15]